MDEDTITTPRTGQRYIIRRPRLTKLLDESEARTLLLLAPGGYGKTTLLREWLAGRNDVAWYAGGPAMADVAALAVGVTGSLTAQAGGEEATERVRALASHGQGAEALAHAVAASVPHELSTLVVDDYHFGADSPETHAFITSLLERTSLRLVLASRTRPAWVTSRMTVYGEVAIVGTTALAFTDEEAKDVLRVRNGERPRVLTQAEGWPAVIGLAAMRPQAIDPDLALPPAELYDYFADDMYRRASPQLQSDVLLLALGADADPRVARQIFGARHDQVLADAAARGFIVRERDAESAMHPLLRHFLLSKLQELDEDESATNLARVIRALSHEDRWDECLVALQGFPQADLIVETLREAFVSLLESGRLKTIEHWVELARDHRITDPVVLLAEAELALRQGETARAQVLGEKAGELLEGDLAARAYLVATRAAHFGDDSAGVLRNAERADAAATSVGPRIDGLWLLVARASEDAHAPTAEAIERLRELRDDKPEHTLRLIHAEALLHLLSDGDVRSAERGLRLGTELLSHVRDPLRRTNHMNTFAQILSMLAEYRPSLEMTARLLEDAETTGLDFVVDFALVNKATALTGLRRFSESRRVVEDLRPRPSMSSAHFATEVTLVEVRLRIATGNLERAAIVLRPDPPGAVGQVLRTEHLAYRGLVLAACGDVAAAKDALKGATVQPGYVGATAVAELGRAIVAIQTMRRGREVVGEVIRRYYTCGHLDSIVTACRAFPPLATAGARDPRGAQALTEILGRSNDVDLGRHAGLDMPRELRRGELLSRRERDIYELVAEGLSNGEIAKRLFISESTVKVHVRHVFEKLGVHTRAEVARTHVPEDAGGQTSTSGN
jgi:ATP/maltotriose-dependent transcriptional regulator MalT